jgi:Cdc25 family phosphatase
MLPTLVRQLEDKETVVFHCALSQQRGPAAALRYIRERERVLAVRKAAEQVGGGAAAAAGAEDKGDRGATAAATDADAGEETAGKKEQRVFVLDRGFVGWQEMHGLDERLTEGYRKELWKDGYWM